MGTKENTEYTSISVGDNIDYLTLKEKNSVIIGENTGINILQNAVVNTEYNVFIGNNAGQYSKEIEKSIFIGANAGKNLEKGSKNIIIGEDSNNVLNNIDNIISIGYNNIFNNSIYNNILGNSNILNNNITNSCNNIIGINNNINNFNNSILLGNYNNIINNTYLSSNLIYIGNNLENTNNYSINLGNTIIKDNTSNIFIGIENNINTCIGFNNINTINNIIRDETSNIYYNTNEILNVVDFTKNIFENELLFEETCNIHNKYYQLYDNTDVKFDIIKVNSNIVDDKIFSYSYITDINNLYYDNKNTLIQKIEENTIINHIEHSLYVNNGIHTDHLSIINNSSNKVSLYSPDNLLSNISYILPKNIDNIDLNKKYILSVSNINELFWILNTDLDDIDTNTRFETLSLDNISNGIYNKYITSNIYNDDLSINGNLNVKSLNIISGGTMSKIATTQDLDNIQGPIGPRGLKGDYGEQGIRGIQGVKGDNGLGIKDISYTDGIITIIRDDDTSYTTNNIIGEKGDGFTNVYYTKNTGKLTFVSDNPQLHYETPSIKGDKGDKGDNCGQIRYFDNNGNFLAEFGDNSISSYDIYIPEGKQGITGSQGDMGPQGEVGPKGDIGQKGDTGSEGPRGPRGFQGTASVIDANYAGDNINIIYDSALSIYKIHGGYTAGANISITNGVISSTDTNTQYSAGNNISINGNIISCTDTHIDTSNYIENVYSNILETSNYINNINDKIIDIDKIDDYTSKFNSNLIVEGTLKASNLEIIGESTIITTNTYQTENIIITNTQGDGVSIKIDHNNNTYNIFEASNFDNFFIIDKNGYIGINKEPVSSLDINGDINFITNINNITSNELNYLKNVNYPIKTNFIDTSNYIDNVYDKIIDTSNYIYNVNTIINTNVNTNFIDTSNYIDNVYDKIIDTSNYIDNVYDKIIDTSNYIDNVYNDINLNIFDTSNYIDNVNINIFDTSNYIDNVYNDINLNILDTSNYIDNVNTNINLDISDTSNYIDNINDNINIELSNKAFSLHNHDNVYITKPNISVTGYLKYDSSTTLHSYNTISTSDISGLNNYVSTNGGTITGDLITTGNIGIGTTIPEYKLHVNGTIACGLDLGNGEPIWSRNSGLTGEEDYMSFGFSVGTSSIDNISDALCIKRKGNVGIGTQNPDIKLEIYDTGDIKSRLYSYTGDSEFQIVAGNDGDIARLSLLERPDTGLIGTLGFTLDYNSVKNIFSINRYNNSSSPEEVLTIKKNSGAINIKGNDLTISCPNYTTIQNGLYVDQGTSALSITPMYLAYLTKSNFSEYGYWGGSKQAIFANGNIMTSSWFLATSDERIKEEIEDVDDGEALEILRKIRPVKYHYKDISRKGQYKTIGFIAQQIKEVLPNAVKITNNKYTYIPNIQEKATCLNNIITLQDDSTFIPIVDSDLQLIGKNKIYKNVIITEIIDDKNFKIHSSDEIDLLDNNEIVLYGEKVNDLHTLAKDCINAVMLSAVQELDKKIESQQQEINMLKQHLGL